MFVDVYDVWPLQGPPEHYRVGNRRAIGWVRRADLLPWDTRLVIRGEGEALPIVDAPDRSPRPITGRSSLPVLEWGTDSITVAVWDPERLWSEVDRRESLRSVGLAGDELGCLALARGAPGPAPADARPGQRTSGERGASCGSARCSAGFSTTGR